MASLLTLTGLVLGVLRPSSGESLPTVGEIIRLDTACERYLPSDAAVEVLASGFTWTEGPVWVGDTVTGHLLFSDIPRNSIFRFDGSEISLFMRPSGYTGVSYYGLEPGSNGLTLDPTGRLVCCEHGDRRISVLTEGGGKVTLVDQYQGKRLNSPNDATFDRQGNLYFTDPPYGLPQRADDPRRELDFCGVYRLSAGGELSLLTDELNRPNGIGLSPDEKTLYVAQSDPALPIWTAYSVQADGSLGPQRILGNASGFMKEYPGLPDGLAVHRDGTVFASGPGGIYVMLPSGQLIARLVTGGRTSNCAFSPDFQTLYITADDKLCRVTLKRLH
ncbi:MAG: SMP-30/gluconolactonase/LRE family protein [Planctomycetota bacterium]